MSDDTFIALGVVTSPHGVKGQVKVKPFTHRSDDLLRYDCLRDASGNLLAFECTGESKGLLICTFDGVGDRNAAEKIKGLELGVSRSQLPDTQPDEFYITDLIGMDVHLENGEPFGAVHSVQNFGAGDIIEIKHEKTTEMFAFTHQNFPQIDMDNRIVTISPPEMVGGKNDS